MKKILSFLLFALCLTVAANAQPVTYDFEDGTIPAAFTNDETYPWIVINTTDDDGNAVRCIKSSNKGVASSISAIEITLSFAADGHISFDALCMGEGTNTAWDKCIFYIDDEVQFTYGAHIAGWNHYAYNVSAGSHTFKWEYKKDNSVNPAGDAFFVDNIEYGEGCVISSIEITGFTEPVYGATPDYDVEVPADANYTLGNVYWSENSIVMNTPVPFGANEYFMNIYIIPNEGCTFSDEVSVTINGNTELVDPFSGVISDGSYHIYTIDYTLSAPSTCETPTNLSVSDITSNSATLSWTGNVEEYEIEYGSGYYYYGFESGDLQGWTNLIVNDEGGYWYHSNDHYDYSDVAHNGTQFVVCYSFIDYDGAYNTDAYLVSPQKYQINNGASLSFWYDMANDDYPEHFEVSVATVDNPTADDFTSIWNSQDDGSKYNAWREASIDLSAYAGQAIWIAFHDVNYDEYEIWIDDITVKTEAWTTVENVTSPHTLNSLEAETPYFAHVRAICDDGVTAWSEPVEFTTTEEAEPCETPTNLTATNITGFDATLGWTDNNNADVWYIDMDEYGDGEWAYFASGNVYSNSFSFHDYFALTPGKTYRYRVQSICSDENRSDFSEYYLFTTMGYCDAEVPTNLTTSDITAHTATVEWTENPDNYYNVRYMRAIIFEDFENDDYEAEDNSLPSGWTTIDADGDGNNWYYNEANERAYSGIGVATSASYINYEGALTPDNWLITPKIDLNGTMRVWLSGQDPHYAAEHFAIYLSTSGNTVDDFTETLVLETIATDEYVEYTADLSAYAGQQGYIAIRHFNVTDQFRLNVDDFGVFLDDDWTTETVTGNSIELTGLEQGSHYLVQVQSVCDGDATSLPNSSLWSMVEFTTTEEPACVITEVNVIGYESPVAGENSQDHLNITVPDNANYFLVESAYSPSWYDEDADYFFFGTFVGGAYYSFGGEIHANDGCVFANNCTFLVNGVEDLVDPEFTGVDEDNTIAYIWTMPEQATGTTSPCETPSGLTASNITATTAKLEWTGSQDQYTVRYKEDAASDWTEATTTNRFFPLTGLTPATTYTAQVQGDCGSGAKVVTDWSDPVTFTTLSGTIEPGECGPAVDCEGTSYPTVKIGDVCWMAKNLAAETCVTTGNVYAYVNDQFPDEDANVETYGLLYDEEAAFATGICPEGYTLPTTEQFEYLKNNFTVEELRNSTGWVVNTGTNGTGFSWDGSGFRNGMSETFDHMLMEGYLWAVDMTSGTPQPAMYKMMYYCNEIVRVYDFDGISASIRCVKNAEPQPEPEPEPEPETFTCGTDNLIIGENSYETVQIGTQCWTKTNMREPVGEEIVSGNAEYPATEAYHFKVPSRDLAIYGYLYNWKAANMVCPTGWHLPTDAEWTQMENVLSTIPIDPDATGDRGDHLGKLAAYDENWDPSSTPNTPGYTEPFDDRNLSGFSARPMGYYWKGFDAQTRYAQFWTATENPEDTTKAYDRWMGYLYTSVQRYSHSKTFGYSVRCVRDSE